MEINFNNRPTYDNIGTDTVDSFRQGIKEGRDERMYQNSQQVYKQAAGGDPQAALTAANAAGNFDAAAHIAQMTAQQRALLNDKLSHAASVAYGLRDIKDPAQRAAVYASSRKALNGYGWSDEDLDGVDLSDNGLTGLINQGQTLTEQLKYAADQRDFNYKVQHDGQIRTDALNKPITAQDGAVLTRNEAGGYDTIYTPGTKPLQQVITDPVTGEVRYVSVPGQPGQSMGASVPGYGGAVPGKQGDVSRLINGDAGGGYVPDSVQNMGQFVEFGRGLNRQGAKSSSSGIYQINGSTMAEFGPKALGPNWRSAPYTAETQDAVAQSIYNWAQNQPNPAAALKGRWVSLSPQQAQSLVGQPWSSARQTIAGGESGQAGVRAVVQGNRVSFAPQGNGGISVTSLGGSSDPVWSAAEQNGLRGQINRRTGEFKADPGQTQGQAGGKPLSEKDVAAARTKLAQARRLKNQILQMQDLDPDGSRLSGGKVNPNRSGIWGGYVQGRVAGGLAGGDTDAYDTLLSNVQNTIGAITRIPGIGSQSDYEARLAAATMPSRTRSASGRAQAYREIWQIAKDMEGELSEQTKGNLGPASRGVSNSQAKPAPTNDRAAQLRNKYGLK